ncbi:hypothetical protein CesoFtcFv8_020413 [Champsocephalus esox]|uniref:CRAL-TRIO domain-containing protein n=1 Tax=Champsocephalus esox TaxID=159716 RepID=A0AAN8BFE7_9TELE|nr:hypothetical protein CesoFtcFv8_020413 [Champsocephalus esox]
MDHLFRYVVGTLDLMVRENYLMVYLCAGGQRDKLPGISWLRECYTTINHRLRKNLKGFYVVHPTWYIKALATIIKPFISQTLSKFSRKLQFVESLQELSLLVPVDQVQIPAVVSQLGFLDLLQREEPSHDPGSEQREEPSHDPGSEQREEPSHDPGSEQREEPSHDLGSGAERRTVT